MRENGRQKRGRKAFFFEKKKQKTFIRWSPAKPRWLNPGAIMGQVRLWALRAAADPTREAPGKSFLLLFFKKEDFALRFLRSSDLEFRGFAGLPRCRRRGWSAFADHDWDRGDFGLSGAKSKKLLFGLSRTHWPGRWVRRRHRGKILFFKKRTLTYWPTSSPADSPPSPAPPPASARTDASYPETH